MLDDWYRVIRLPITIEQFHRLPRNAAYKYEYLDDYALLSPRPKTLNAMLTLQRLAAPPEIDAHGLVRFRLLQKRDWSELPELFSAAFHRMQPFASLSDDERLKCSEECIEQTRTGGDGPVIGPACFVAECEKKDVLGAILITLIPERPEGEWWSGRWDEQPPDDAIEKRLGRPHLTWVFVAPLCTGHGIASALLAHSVNALLDLGFTEMATTFLVGNDVSTLWHWRNGFRLLPYAGSPRKIRQRSAPK